MKLRLLTVFALIITLLSFTVSAELSYNITVDENFSVVTADDDLKAMSQKLNISEDSLSSYFKSGLLYLAVSKDNQTQIKLSSYTDEFSSTVKDISFLDGAAIEEFKNTLCGDGDYICTTQINKGRTFIVMQKTLSDSGGIYTVTQYITICDGKSYHLSCYNPGTQTSDTVKSIFESFSLNVENGEVNTQEIKTLPPWFFITSIAVFLLASIITAISIIRFYKTKQNNDE